MMSQELPYFRKIITRIAVLIRDNLEKNYIPPKLTGDIEFDEMYISAGNKGVKKKLTKTNFPRRRGLKQRGRGTYEKR
jgi:hypothetical protein